LTGEKPSTAALFPGQGTRPCRRETEEFRPDLIEALDDLIERDAFAGAGSSTACAQPAIYCASLALWSVDKRREVSHFAGHSLGEITALAAAGWIDEIDGLRLVIRRGALMQEACDRATGGMIALLEVSLEEAMALGDAFGLSLAGDNCPGQVVLAGEVKNIDALEAEAKRRRAISLRLPVAGAFHSPLMEPAVASLEAALGEVKLTPHDVPVLSADTLAPFQRPAKELATALTRPVRWREVLQLLSREGVRSFAVTGPGRALAPMVAKTLPLATMV
jgi:[acyl-carrier-protein] S-malonyltransferase